MQAFFQGIHPMMVSFLDIRVRREAVLDDALAQLVARHDDLKKPLRITFISAGVDEEAQVSRFHDQLPCLQSSLIRLMHKPKLGIVGASMQSNSAAQGS